jgi:subtilisin family serine protease
VPNAGGQTAETTAEPVAATAAQHSPDAGQSVRITLLTGDTIIYTDSGGAMPSIGVQLDPASGTREIDILRGPDGVYAIPDQAQPLIDADVLDRELFDVQYLAENGYTDADRDSIPVIVTYDRAVARQQLGAHGLSTRTDALAATESDALALRSINGAGVAVHKATADRFWHDVASRGSGGQEARTSAMSREADTLRGGVAKIWLDGRAYASLDESRDQIGVPAAWQAGVDGSGAKVAVLDSGYDAGHPDLAGQVIESRSFVPDQAVQDGAGHGTHVASTIAGTGAASNGRYAGVAPGADLLVGKVLGNAGWGLDSWIIAGMEWAGANADVVNMSLGSNPTDGTDPMSQAVNRISAETGALFVIAAGNYGPGARTVTTPSTSDAALAVAAVDPVDQSADFSSRGPRFRDGALKPEIAAPGDPIVAAWPAGVDPYPGIQVGPHYAAEAGTSMASPHVAAVAAMLVQQHPDWDGQQLKDALMSTSFDAGLDIYQQGAGRVDAARATRQHLFATGKADLGTTSYPTSAATEQTQTVTYTNTGDAALDLTLDVDVDNRRGDPAGDALALSDDTIEVPPHASASVDLTLDPTRADPGNFSGYVRATDGDDNSVQTAVAYVVDGPTYDVTVELTDRYGEVPRGGSVILQDASDPSLLYDAHDTDAAGRAVFDVPPGDYAVQGIIRTADRLDPRRNFAVDVFAADVLDVDSDRAVRIDGTRAVDVDYDLTGERRPVEPVQTTQTLYRTAGNGALTVTAQLSSRWDNNGHFGAVPSDRPAIGDLETTTLTTLREPLIRASIDHRGSDLFTVTPEWTGRFSGSRRAEVVDVGLGRPEDYEGIDANGKIVLVTSDEAYVQPQVDTAAAQGALAVLVTHDAPGIVAVSVDNDNTMPVVGTTYDDGSRLRQLLDRRPVRLELTGVAESNYTYTLRSEEHGAIPDHLTYRFKRSDLAEVSNAFHSDAPRMGSATLGVYEAWEGGAFQYLTPLVQPTRRTDYVSAGPDLRQRLQMSTTRSFNAASLTGEPTAYRRGQHASVSWFNAPNHPSASTEMPCNFCRSDYILWFASSGVGDSEPTHYGSGRFYPTYRFYRDGTQFENPDLLLTPEPATYRIDQVLDVAPDAEHLLANHAETSWTFRSKAPSKLEIDGCRGLLPGANACTALPIILLGYDLPLSLDNSARAHHRFAFEIDTSRAKAYDGPARVDGMRVWASYDDGASWDRASTSRLPGRHSEGFRVVVRHPRLSSTNGYVSLRVETWDHAGSRTTQTITRAYALER